MARPKSEEKKIALLNAAATIVAEHGLSAAPTAKIAKLAGVAEGTLFRYFATKDELLNALYVYIKQNMCVALAENYSSKAIFKLKFKCLWDNYIDWGLNNPIFYQVVNQLVVSSVLTKNTLLQTESFFPDIGVTEKFSNNKIFAGHTDYAGAVFDAIANTTIAFATKEPNSSLSFKECGFSALWKIHENN